MLSEVVAVLWSLSHVWLFCDPMNCSPPGSSVHRISKIRILEWVAISSSRRSSQPKDWTHVSCLAGRFFTTEPPGKGCFKLITSNMPSLLCQSIFNLKVQRLRYLWMSPRLWATHSSCAILRKACPSLLSLVPCILQESSVKNNVFSSSPPILQQLICAHRAEIHIVCQQENRKAVKKRPVYVSDIYYIHSHIPTKNKTAFLMSTQNIQRKQISEYLYFLNVLEIHNWNNFLNVFSGFPDGSVGKESACNARDIGDTGSVPGWGWSPGEGHGNPLQYSCLTDRGAWWATVHRVAKTWAQLKGLGTQALSSLLQENGNGNDFFI